MDILEFLVHLRVGRGCQMEQDPDHPWDWSIYLYIYTSYILYTYMDDGSFVRCFDSPSIRTACH